MSKHTPGPWRQKPDNKKSVQFYITGSAYRNPGWKNVPKNEVNAEHIVACVNALEDINPEAVPDLIAITKLILKEWEAPVEGIQRGELIARLSQYANEARAAITKVEGRDK